jgi:hypothetical protein
MARTFSPLPFTRPPLAASAPHRAAWPLSGRAPESNSTLTYRAFQSAIMLAAALTLT